MAVSDMYEETLKRIKGYRERKNNDIFDSFYHSHLDYIETCMGYYERNAGVDRLDKMKPVLDVCPLCGSKMYKHLGATLCKNISCKCYDVPWEDYVKNNTVEQFADDVKAVFSKTKSHELEKWLYGCIKNEENTAAEAAYQAVIDKIGSM
ncbi:MAG: hypothetical protein HFH68_01615 [Lachnospiraceae bacterium]|nr:hypothetical protein [Lachnospiraceae bacterium]